MISECNRVNICRLKCVNRIQDSFGKMLKFFLAWPTCFQTHLKSFVVSSSKSFNASVAINLQVLLTEKCLMLGSAGLIFIICVLPNY